MLLRTKSSMSSAMLWPRPGTTFMRRVASQKSTKSTATTRNRIRMMRLISKGVPSKKMTGGKKSSSDGPWNSPESPSAEVANGSM